MPSYRTSNPDQPTETMLTNYSRYKTHRELVPILISLCARSLTNGSQEPPKLLIMGNKADLLTKPSSVANQPLSSPATSKATSPSLDAKAYTLARERLESLLTRELTRAKSSRASSTGRIEGIDAVPSGTVSTSLLGYVKRLLRLGTGAAVGQAGEAERDAKEEEWRVEQAEDAMWGERNGSFKFSDVDGVDIQFAVGSAMGGKGLESQDGLTELKDWLSEL
ncbi:hypothetical protein QFC19_000157 [Naganishia cerealis]|uniref:Uncharacterized protein n=1 Tax=Naganishia cerealis TaxID=610337 RepID=A0ACC2WRC9_9TREE|nr:hypothetical protein QFC19_000157 [Naganishia cerealis]